MLQMEKIFRERTYNTTLLCLIEGQDPCLLFNFQPVRNVIFITKADTVSGNVLYTPPSNQVDT